LPALEFGSTAGEHPVDSGMWVAEVSVVSDALLMPFDGRTSGSEVRSPMDFTELKLYTSLNAQN